MAKENRLEVGAWRGGKRKLTYGSVEGLERKSGNGYLGELVTHTGMTGTMRYSYEVRKWFLDRAREILGEDAESTPDAYALRLEKEAGR